MDAEAEEGSSSAFMMAALGEEKVEEEPSTTNALLQKRQYKSGEEWVENWKVTTSLKRRQALQQMDSKAPTSQGRQLHADDVVAATIEFNRKFKCFCKCRCKCSSRCSRSWLL